MCDMWPIRLECKALDIEHNQSTLPSDLPSAPPPVDNGDTVFGPQLPQLPHYGNNRMMSVITAYTTSPETKASSSTTIAQLRDIHQLKLQGRNPPLPITSFDDCGLPAKLLLNILENKHYTPTPVQMQVVPAGLEGRDMLISAETGSGKSASFLIPILTHAYGLAQVYGSSMQSSPMVSSSGSNQGPYALILAPTRELAMQIEEMAKAFAKGLPNMLTALLVGGYAMANQVHRLRQSVQIAVATPGRLLDIITRHPEFTFSNVFCLVLDEVDMMFSLGFGKQVKRILDVLPTPPNGRQTIMCSATIPKQVQLLTKKILDDPLTIQLGHPPSKTEEVAQQEKSLSSQSSKRSKGQDTPDIFSPASRIKQTILWVENVSKKKQLFSLLNDPKYYRPPVLVFVESRLGADLLATAIEAKCKGIKAVAMHAEKSQDERTELLKAIVEGTIPVVVATGLLARGLNLNVATVINFDMAPSVQEYVHRVGRANPDMATKAAVGIRKGPKLGGMAWAITFVNNDHSHILRELANMLHGLGLERVTPLPPQLKQLVDQKPVSGTGKQTRVEISASGSKSLPATKAIKVNGGSSKKRMADTPKLLSSSKEPDHPSTKKRSHPPHHHVNKNKRYKK
ncbi:DEAD (Asp-Glu-Ala-Asp) box polypeptide 59 [Podila horticola]|nr:DEAD (Asp-Glu-Ala-Asp) box polypeptide 59 [Podila horticola]